MEAGDSSICWLSSCGDGCIHLCIRMGMAILLGAFAGALLKEQSFIRSASNFGSILYAIIDWDLIEEFLEIPTKGRA